jgi:hypothetical protein
VLAVAIAVPVLILVGVYVATEADRDWTRVASVNGIAIDRGHLRDEVAFQRFLLAEETSAIQSATIFGRLDANAAVTERTALLNSVGDPIEDARSALVDDELVRQLAAREGVTVNEPYPFAELASFLDSMYSRHVRSVTIRSAGAASNTTPDAPVATPIPTIAPGGGPAPLAAYPRGSASAAGSRAGADLAAGVDLASVVAALRAGGYDATSDDRWIGLSGAISGIDPSLVASARSAAPGGLIGPFIDRRGAVVAGALVAIANPDRGTVGRLTTDLANAQVNPSALADWAHANALRDALDAVITNRLVSTPTREVRGRELVVGPANPDGGSSGPWVELAALGLDGLGFAPVGSSSPASAPTAAPGATSGPGPATSVDALVADLRTRTPPGRVALFRSLAATANAHAGATGAPSGELGLLTRGDISPTIGNAVFATGVQSGDVIGPLKVNGAPMLFLVEARYGGVLDQRSVGALTEARAPGVNLGALAAKFSPPDVALAADSGWFAQSESATGDPIGTTLFATPVGEISDPIALDGDLALFSPIETRTVVPAGAVRDRLTVTGFATWYQTERTRATIVLDTNPLPIATPSPSASTGPQATIPPLATPFVPTIPGLAPASATSANPGGVNEPGGAPAMPGGGAGVGVPTIAPQLLPGIEPQMMPSLGAP